MSFFLKHRAGALVILLLLAILAAPATAQTTGPYSLYLPATVNQPVSRPNWNGATGGVVCLVADPSNDQILYAGTWGGGVFRSEDQGDSWTWAGAGLLNFQINALAIDPVTPQTLYAGTYGGGLFKTTDGGRNWSLAASGLQTDAIIYGLAVSPLNPREVYAATRRRGTSGGPLTPPYYGVLYKTSDGGESWRPVLENVGGPESQDWVYSIAVKADLSVILVATHEHGPFISTTGEAGSWVPAGMRGRDDWDKGRTVAFDPTPGSTTAYYATWHGGFYRSDNNGLNWTEHGDHMNGKTMGDVHAYPNGIAFADPPSIMYLATADQTLRYGVMKSVDGGRHWDSMGLNSELVYTVVAVEQDGRVVLAGTDGFGIFKSVNGGATWANSNRGLEVHP